MCIRFVLLVNTLFFLIHFLQAQTVKPQQMDTTWYQAKRNSAYLELFGGPNLYSFNYQRLSDSHTRLAFTYRVGASFLPTYGGNITGYVGGLIGKPNKAFEFLMGVGYLGTTAAKIYLPEQGLNNLYLTPQLGYRSQKARDKILFRAMFTPWFIINEGLSQSKLRLSLGLSLGKAF